MVLLLLMGAIGLMALYEAIHRFFIPFEPQVDWFAFLVGLRSGIMALIAPSVDSRKHVISAASVTAGLIA